MPYLLGSNFEEGLLFMLAANPKVATEAEYLAALERTFGASGPDVARVYPVSDFATPHDALVRVWGDSRLVCSTTETARRVSANGASVYSFNFARPIPALEALEATHGVELPYVFGTLADPPAEDAALSDTMQAYWTRFATSGDPNGEDAPEWPPFDDASEERMNLDVAPSVIAGFRSTECDFRATIYDAAFR
jgi:para-nitrobenzyl esterase